MLCWPQQLRLKLPLLLLLLQLLLPLAREGEIDASIREVESDIFCHFGSEVLSTFFLLLSAFQLKGA